MISFIWAWKQKAKWKLVLKSLNEMQILSISIKRALKQYSAEKIVLRSILCPHPDWCRWWNCFSFNYLKMIFLQSILTLLLTTSYFSWHWNNEGGKAIAAFFFVFLANIKGFLYWRPVNHRVCLKIFISNTWTIIIYKALFKVVEINHWLSNVGT